ncbi:MAG: Crp/Fnr family transcriptional regulator [Bacteroidetes bacterium]|nr:Crp/Fnr family transcriptional regulator [Bacteroidota bacterium]
MSSSGRSVKDGRIAAYRQLYGYILQIMPDLREASWRIMEGVVEFHTYEKNELILRPGTNCPYVWFISRGLVELYHVVGGKHRVNDLVAENNFFSDLNSFLLQVRSNLGIKALEETETLRIKYSDVQYIYANTKEADRIGRLLAERLLVAQSQRINELTLLSPEQRYRQFLARSPQLVLRVPQYKIASYLSLTPETLSRIRARLGKDRGKVA